MSAHEDSGRRHDVGGRSSDRVFGLVMAGVLAALALWPLLDAGRPVWWLLAIADVLLAAAVVRPAWLSPINRAWTALGLLLHRVVTPVVLGLIFFGSVTPIGLLMRLFGKDPLRLKLERGAASYWIARTPPGPEPQSMRQQF
ncbi:MAG: hypothetical protein FJX56_13755 [Alphaproteobacteria bacterium]|nr:hypothetical protein [Alphaproteobacteria bacterium]